MTQSFFQSAVRDNIVRGDVAVAIDEPAVLRRELIGVLFAPLSEELVETEVTSIKVRINDPETLMSVRII